jgi:hypothetical protein
LTYQRHRPLIVGTAQVAPTSGCLQTKQRQLIHDLIYNPNAFGFQNSWNSMNLPSQDNAKSDKFVAFQISNTFEISCSLEHVLPHVWTAAAFDAAQGRWRPASIRRP